MKAKLIEMSDKELVLQVTFKLEAGMLKTEESIQDSLNLAGCLATEIALSRFGTSGEPIMTNLHQTTDTPTCCQKIPEGKRFRKNSTVD